MGEARNIKDLQVGKAGEHLVCADLIMKGFIAYPSEQGLHYDVVCDYGGKLLKIQVKTTSKKRYVPQRKTELKKYSFNIRRCGKGGRHSYENGDVDIFALVALDIKTIGYIKDAEAKQSIYLSLEKLASYKFENCF